MTSYTTNFLDFYQQVKSFEKNLISLATLNQTCKTFYKYLDKLEINDIIYMKDTYYDLISTCNFLFLEFINSYPSLRSHYDKIFKSKLNITKKIPKGITTLFDKFIQGITYFEYQRDKTATTPIYHRFYSCHTGIEVYRKDNLICFNGMNKIEKNRRRSLIERYYIERTIYDILWKHEMLHFPSRGNDTLKQDEGHMFRLEETKKDFESCFKNFIIKVDIEWQDSIPIILTITRLRKNKEYSQEIYYKLYNFNYKEYDYAIECTKLYKNMKFQKIQTFSKEVDWKKI